MYNFTVYKTYTIRSIVWVKIGKIYTGDLFNFNVYTERIIKMTSRVEMENQIDIPHLEYPDPKIWIPEKWLLILNQTLRISTDNR